MDDEKVAMVTVVGCVKHTYTVVEYLCAAGNHHHIAINAAEQTDITTERIGRHLTIASDTNTAVSAGYRSSNRCQSTSTR